MKLAYKLILTTSLGFITIILIDSMFLINREVEYIEKEGLHSKLLVIELLRNSSTKSIEELEGLSLISRDRFDTKRKILEKVEFGKGVYFVQEVDDLLSVYTEQSSNGDKRYLEAKFQTRTLRDINELYRRTFIIVAIGLLISFIYLSLTGVYFIGRPLKTINRKIKDMERGEFLNDMKVPGNDELSDLCNSLNALSRKIDQANSRVEKENDEKLEYLKQLRHAERLTTAGMLTSGIAHELGTPLNVVLGHSSLISSRSNDEAVIKSSRVINEQIKKMSSLIESILVFCNKNYKERKTDNLGTIIRSSINLIQYQFKKKNVECKFIDDVNAEIVCDSQKLEQVLVNLLINANDAVEKNGIIEVSIIKSIEKRIKGKVSKFHKLEIKDNGCGIPEGSLDKIFEPFFTSKDIGEGTGLGLSISAGIIEEHGGWIDVKSQVGEGTCFIIYLPVSEVHE